MEIDIHVQLLSKFKKINYKKLKLILYSRIHVILIYYYSQQN